MKHARITGILALLGPGILVAATGIGAGDLATASMTGSVVGLAVLWAVILGAFLKFVINEGLARWQLITGETLLEGCVHRFGSTIGRLFRFCFLAYLLLWSFFVGGALMSAVGVTSHAIFSLTQDAHWDKCIYGLAHSLLAVILIELGGYRLFEKVMSVCIAMMFLVVVSTAICLNPPWMEVFQGIVQPRIPAGGLTWTVAMMGGVGGTLTVLCYGYWIREEGREGQAALQTCRVDLATGYVVTALFGLAMVVIGHHVGGLTGKGANLVVDIAGRLQSEFGSWGSTVKWMFMIGAWGAVFSSLLGVWQSVPYLFADFLQLGRTHPAASGNANSPEPIYQVNTKGWPYRLYLAALATIPAIGMFGTAFSQLQKVNAIVGALCIPSLCLILLVLNGNKKWMGSARSRWTTQVLLIATLVFFVSLGVSDIRKRFVNLPPAASESR